MRDASEQRRYRAESGTDVALVLGGGRPIVDSETLDLGLPIVVSMCEKGVNCGVMPHVRLVQADLSLQPCSRRRAHHGRRQRAAQGQHRG